MPTLQERNQNMLDFFESHAEGYDDVHAPLMDFKVAITEALDPAPARVLDLGGGTGMELIPLFTKYPEARVTVIDISPTMLEQLKARPFADRVTVLCGDFFALDWGVDYDAVISSSALHHFTEADKARLFAKVLAALRPGGQFINSDKYAADQAEQDEDFAQYAADPHRWPHMDTPLTPENEARILREVGFTEVTVTYLGEKYSLVTGRKEQ